MRRWSSNTTSADLAKALGPLSEGQHRGEPFGVSPLIYTPGYATETG